MTARGREQAGQRPVLVVSSRFHLALTGGALVSVLPLTTRERPGWVHRVRIDTPVSPPAGPSLNRSVPSRPTGSPVAVRSTG
ncbi:type II toxin-antitoxin system PemK/MazF family toxin [Frankia sp. Cr2]|uniref:type II toxin-antitoxin system PemK/MazF family toxin n=1 Tax=Frankia sp. Cr2 TaxID=3073932 RepID=UPI003A100674